MINYLSESQLSTNLNLGKPLEQWIGYQNEEDYTVIKWIRIDKEKNGNFSVTYFETFDEGNEEFLDVYEFSAVDPDEPYGIINSFSSLNDAIIFAVHTYNATLEKFVPAGIIQDEYANYLKLGNREDNR